MSGDSGGSICISAINDRDLSTDCFNVFKIGFKDPAQLNIPAGSKRGIRYWPQALSTAKKSSPLNQRAARDC
jgi:hypothetical protein